MGLNKATGNMYEFLDFTWNTVKGACPHACTYCYMKKWGKQKPVRFDNKELKTDLGQDNFIFVGSSCDMFAGRIPSEWIRKTLDHCTKHSDNKYLFQSKDPASMFFHLEELVDYQNIVVCTTIETNRIYRDIMVNSPWPTGRATAMRLIPFPRYVTIEPIMDFDHDELVDLIQLCNPEQVNIGADSGGNRLPEPSAGKVRMLIEALGDFTKVVKKKNLGRLLR